MIRPPRPLRTPCWALVVAAACAGPPPAPQEDAGMIEALAGVEGAEPTPEFDEEAYLAALEAEYAELEQGNVQDEGPRSPFQDFGKRIMVYRSGFVAKPYYFPTLVGAKALALLQDHSGLRIHEVYEGLDDVPPAGGPQPEDSVVLHLIPGFDKEAFSDPRSDKLDTPFPVELSDMLVVTAMPAQLHTVEDFLRSFIADVRQIEIEAKIVEVTTRRTMDVGIRPVDSATPIFGLPNAGTLVNSIDFSFGNTVTSSEAIFRVSSVLDGVEFNALIEAVATRENVTIISRPKVAVREGGRADVRTTRRIPFFKVGAINASGNFTSNLEFIDVGVQMYVIPRVIGRDTVILSIDVEASQQTGTAVALTQSGGENPTTISVPEISTRRATTTVRLEPGQAVLLGGLITERTLVRERKIPGLGDIPVLGNLFKSTFTETEQTNVLFFIRPRILQGIDLNADGF